jgi:dipeptidase E
MIDPAIRLLLISNSTLHGSGYLDHAEAEIRNFVGARTKVVFLPYALHDRAAYTAQAKERFRKMDLALSSVHDISNPQRAIAEAEIVFVGGGNTFRLVKSLHEIGLIEPIRRAIAAGALYIGSSAGSIVSGPSLRTTKDMPIVQPPSFDALGLVPFQISPHYLDPDPNSTHMGETQEQRILQFLEENHAPVVGLREGSLLRVHAGTVVLKGPYSARIFRKDCTPVEAAAGSDLQSFLADTAAAGKAA